MQAINLLLEFEVGFRINRAPKQGKFCHQFDQRYIIYL